MECAYCVAIMLICLNMFLIFVIEIVNVVSKFFIDGICVVPLAHATSTMSGATFQPFAMMLFMSGWYFMIFCLGFSGKSIMIAICEFDELYGDIKCRGFGGGGCGSMDDL